MKHIIVLAALIGAVFAAPAQAAYPPVPPALAAYTCPGGTFSSLATLKTAVQTGAAQRYCLANSGTAYTGGLSINRTATGQATISAVTRNGATINGGVIAQGGSVKYQGIALENINPAAGTNGDCFTVEAAVTVATELSYSNVHDCNRKGFNMKQGANNLSVVGNHFYTTGLTDVANGQAVTIKAPASAGVVNVTANLFDDLLDDAIQASGSGVLVRRNVYQGSFPCATCHNDFLQAITGSTLPGVIVERNRTRGIGGANAHFLYGEGAGVFTNATIRSNEIVDVGTGAISVSIGGPTLVGASTNVKFQNNTIVNSGRVEYQQGSSGVIEGNLWRDCNGSGPWAIFGGVVTLNKNTGDTTGSCTAVGPGATNDSSATMFVNEASRDLHLGASASVIDTGLTVSPGGFDIDDGTRILDGPDPDTIAVVERGADEYTP